LRSGGWPADFAESYQKGAVSMTLVGAMLGQVWDDPAKALIVLSGPTGIGKTWEACRRAVESEVWGQGSRFYSDLDGLRTHSMLTQLYGCGMLIIDDVGSEEESSRNSAAVERLITRRLENRNRRTIITTNLNRPSFETRYGARIASRLEKITSAWIPITGPDLRRGN
jgi:DNA replication protein DnaC